METSASTTRSIVDIFSAQLNKNQSRDERVLSTSLPAIFSPKNTENEVRGTRFESQTQAVHDLSELLRLKTVQMDKYGLVLDHKSNLYWKHQMVQSFLWMKLNKKKDNQVETDKVWFKLLQIASIDELILGIKLYNENDLRLKITQYQVPKLESTNTLYHG